MVSTYRFNPIIKAATSTAIPMINFFVYGASKAKNVIFKVCMLENMPWTRKHIASTKKAQALEDSLMRISEILQELRDHTAKLTAQENDNV